MPNVLMQAFLRLASDWLVAGAFYYGGEKQKIEAMCTSSIPNNFQSEVEASVHLDALSSEHSHHELRLFETALKSFRASTYNQDNAPCHECARTCLTLARLRIATDTDLGSSLVRDNSRVVSTLRQWRIAFDVLVDCTPTSRSLLLLEMQCLRIWLASNTINDSEQTICDGFENDWRRMICLAEECLSDSESSIPNETRLDRHA